MHQRYEGHGRSIEYHRSCWVIVSEGLAQGHCRVTISEDENEQEEEEEKEEREEEEEDDDEEEDEED